MNKLSVCLSCILLFGCASKEKDNVIPDWVLHPIEHCEKDEICGVGEGNTMTMAQANARNEVAKQLKVNVKGDFTSQISQKNNIDSTEANDNINEITDEVLQGMKIAQSFVDDKNNYYSFAVVNKASIITDIKNQINEIDSKMLLNLQQKPFKFSSTKKMYNERELLNQKYLFLTGSNISKKVSLDNILKAKDRSLIYKIEIDNNISGLEKVLTRKIADNKDKVNNKAFSPDRIIRGEVKLEKGYLNVNGFEKYSVFVNLECVENGEVIGSITFEDYKTGRAKAHVIERVKKELMEYIDSHIDNLLG